MSRKGSGRGTRQCTEEKGKRGKYKEEKKEAYGRDDGEADVEEERCRNGLEKLKATEEKKKNINTEPTTIKNRQRA